MTASSELPVPSPKAGRRSSVERSFEAASRRGEPLPSVRATSLPILPPGEEPLQFAAPMVESHPVSHGPL